MGGRGHDASDAGVCDDGKDSDKFVRGREDRDKGSLVKVAELSRCSDDLIPVIVIVVGEDRAFRFSILNETKGDHFLAASRRFCCHSSYLLEVVVFREP